MDNDEIKESAKEVLRKCGQHIDAKSTEVTESIISTFLESLDEMPEEMTSIRIDVLRTLIRAVIKSAMHEVTSLNFNEFAKGVIND